ncbi:hypothetical protein F4678DRAFT_443010 [Xylaria arbuscula]|nr:hypothetical protein F4678DRAFT_443010 [Xylaria arbuscula]
MAKIFLTGATGYIGGDLLCLLSKTHPEYRVRVLNRNPTHIEAIKRAFNEVEVVDGSLDSTGVISREAGDADVVLHLAATGHLNSVQTIHQALQERPKNKKPPYWIQISGATNLAAAELADKCRIPGTANDTAYNDLEGVESIWSLIKQHPSRTVDNYILSASANTPGIKTALVVPPIIYGRGRGPVNQRSIQIPTLAKVTLERRGGLQVGPGLSRWGNVHIKDLSQLLLRLVENAVEGSGDINLWSRNGLYLAGVGELSFGEISKRVVAAAYGLTLLPSEDIEELNGEQADNLLPHGVALFGTNARSQAHRAQKLLGWTATHETLEQEIPRVVEEEARALRLLKAPVLSSEF